MESLDIDGVFCIFSVIFSFAFRVSRLVPSDFISMFVGVSGFVESWYVFPSIIMDMYDGLLGGDD